MTTGRDAIYLQVEVGAISAADDLARLIGISADTALAGVVRFWHACIRDNRRIAEFQHVDRATLATLTASSFGRTVEPEQLSLLGFVRKADEAGDLWRVRGLSRYVEMEEKRATMAHQRSAGGRARSGAKRADGGQFTSSTPAADQLNTSSTPAADQQSTTLDGRRETGKETMRAKKPRAAEWTDDEKKARASIEAIFLKARGIPLPWTQTMDSAPFRAKLNVYGLERMERYWRFALTTEDKFLRVSTVASLCGKNFARIADAAEGTASTRAPICEVIS